MINDVNILKLASSMARHATARHQLLSQNIANADTNNYKAKDLERFSDAYARMAGRPDGKLDGASLDRLDKSQYKIEALTGNDLASPNGNTVSIEDQMMRSAETQQQFDAAIAIYKKSIDILRSTLGRGA